MENDAFCVEEIVDTMEFIDLLEDSDSDVPDEGEDDW